MIASHFLWCTIDYNQVFSTLAFFLPLSLILLYISFSAVSWLVDLRRVPLWTAPIQIHLTQVVVFVVQLVKVCTVIKRFGLFNFPCLKKKTPDFEICSFADECRQFVGQSHPHGSIFSPKPCTECQCNNGHLNCTTQDPAKGNFNHCAWKPRKKSHHFGQWSL